jgi:hypothetical protein
VQAAADRTRQLGQPALDGHVDVLVVLGEREAAVGQLALHRVQAGEQRVAVGLLDDAPSREHPGVRPRLRDVERPQPVVEGQRRVERPERRVLRLGEARHGVAAV